MFIKHLILFFAMASITMVNAQSVLQENGTWFTLSNSIKVSEKITVSQISQMRRVDYFKNIQVVMLKPSISYELSKVVSVGIGYVSFNSFPNGVWHASIKKKENRIWEHLTLTTKLGKTALSNRFVFEQRFKDIVNTAASPNVHDGHSYAQRFRYRLLTSFKLVELSDTNNLWAKISNEVRIRFNTGLSQPDFDQNNFYVYLGIDLIKNSKFWVGYGRDYKKVRGELFIAHDIIHVAVSYDFDLTQEIDKNQ
jgi:hypothetical protein